MPDSEVCHPPQKIRKTEMMQNKNNNNNNKPCCGSSIQYNIVCAIEAITSKNV